MIRRLTVIGVGLIGGSLARALREHRAVGEVVGCGRGRDNLERAVQLGVIDRYKLDPGRAVQGADLVFIAVPLGSMRNIFAALRDQLAPDAVVTDGGSVKGCVVQDAEAVFGGVPPFLVPGHPIAGTEHSGVEASFASLYQDRRVILTPPGDHDPAALERVSAMWRLCGAEVTRMEVHHHDEVLAATIRLPHAGLQPGRQSGPDAGERRDFPLCGGRFSGLYPHQRPVVRSCGGTSAWPITKPWPPCWPPLPKSCGTWRRRCNARMARNCWKFFSRAKAARDGSWMVSAPVEGWRPPPPGRRSSRVDKS